MNEQDQADFAEAEQEFMDCGYEGDWEELERRFVGDMLDGAKHLANNSPLNPTQAMLLLCRVYGYEAPTFVGYRFDSTSLVEASPTQILAKGERPEGVPELALVVAQTEERAREILFEQEEDCRDLDWTITAHVEDCAIKAEEVMLVQRAPKRPPVLCANDLYKLPGRESYESRTKTRKTEVTELWDYLHDHFFEEIDLWSLDDEENTRVTTRVIYDLDFDGRRCMTMATIWFDGHPIGISQAAGREGRDHKDRFITDLDRYREAVSYLLTLYKVEEDEPTDVLDPNEPNRALNYFYGNFVMFGGEG